MRRSCGIYRLWQYGCSCFARAPASAFGVMTPEESVQRRLSMLWGARSFLQAETDYETAVEEARQLVLSEKIGWRTTNNCCRGHSFR